MKNQGIIWGKPFQIGLRIIFLILSLFILLWGIGTNTIFYTITGIILTVGVLILIIARLLSKQN